jgi:glutaminase
VAALVQQYLDRIRLEHVDVGEGMLAGYIPELTRVDPNGFGLSLSSSDGFVYETGDTAVEFTIQSISKPFTYALALQTTGQRAVDAKIGVEPSGEPSTRSASTAPPRLPRTR